MSTWAASWIIRGCGSIRYSVLKTIRESTLEINVHAFIDNEMKEIQPKWIVREIYKFGIL